MGKFQATQKYFAVFLALFACYDSLLSHGRQIKPLNLHSSLNKGTAVPDDNHQSLNVPTPSSEKNKVDSSVVPKHGVTSLDDSSADTNAFRPTTPGNSPGVGHRKFAGQDKDMKAMVVQSPDVKVYVTEASKNDFKPTEPGHSPGVGHPQQNKIGQLN